MTLARLVEFRAAIDAPWTHFEPVRLGAVPPAPPVPPAPDRYVLLTEGGMPALRLDLYCDLDHSEREDATFVGDWLAVGYGARVHLVSLSLPRPRAPRSIQLRSYFCGFFALPTERALLVASGEDVTLIDRTGRIAWTSPMLAVDGVQIERVRGDYIEGVGEHAPPGDCRPFRIRLADGTVA
ncbi:MAG TPA: hypothetical protein VKA84_08150 [Gemmatimonadaceae bacterium]|nr:hypothetical protein [Gemmatimonadaceae bacterium]